MHILRISCLLFTLIATNEAFAQNSQFYEQCKLAIEQNISNDNDLYYQLMSSDNPDGSKKGFFKKLKDADNAQRARKRIEIELELSAQLAKNPDDEIIRHGINLYHQQISSENRDGTKKGFFEKLGDAMDAQNTRRRIEIESEQQAQLAGAGINISPKPSH